jgi:protein-L-isoaspartate(D-aspartate) O-methyltransferase
MVETQLIPRGITDSQVLGAMMKVPRHLFVPEHLQEKAYNDYPLPIGEGQTISQPYMVAQMTEVLELTKESLILEIGTGSGYQTAILAEIVQKVYTIERIEVLAKRAKDLLNKLGYRNIFIKIGDGTIGWKEYSPYDRILITAGTPKVPSPLFDQLKEGGIIIVPIGDRVIQTLTRVRKIKGKIVEEKLFDCMFVPLIGKYGWKDFS